MTEHIKYNCLLTESLVDATNRVGLQQGIGRLIVGILKIKGKVLSVDWITAPDTGVRVVWLKPSDTAEFE